MKRILTFILAAFFAISYSYAQITVTVGAMSISATDTLVIVPVNVTNFTNISAVSLKINYKNSSLTWIEARNWNTSGSTIAMAFGQNGVASISAFDLTPINIGTGKLVDLVFRYNSGATKLTFNTKASDITDFSGASKVVTYTNGYVKTPLAGFDVKGVLTYDNASGTPVQGATLYLKDNTSAIIDSVVSDASGNYDFTIVDNGTYTLDGSCSKSWSGVNSTDALNIRLFLAGSITLSDIRQKASDVNGSNSINSTDALTIRRRLASMVDSFSIPDWVFETPSVTVNSADVTQNIKTLCTGDVNGSNTPSLK
jgi:hypothetical protein